MEKRTVLVMIYTLAASILPTIIFSDWLGGTMSPVPFQIAFLSSVSLYHVLIKDRYNLSKYTVMLTAVVTFQFLAGIISRMPWWREMFDLYTFTGNFGGTILLKFIFVIPIIVLLLLFYRSPREVYLTKGDLSVRAERIGWLGIEENRITWSRLSVISAFLISFGTLLLTVLTVTGFSIPQRLSELPGMLPLIIIFALVNSFSEGVVYRSAIMGPLKKVLRKEEVILTAAVFFGIGHYYGAPSGMIGVLMSSLLGWFMCRSMYETNGFLSAWIIHFMQDAVIFSAIIVMG